MDAIQYILIMFFSAPLIALFDYLLFRKYLVCDNCKIEPSQLHWVIPCLIETLFFLAGITIGGLLK